LGYAALTQPTNITYKQQVSPTTLKTSQSDAVLRHGRAVACLKARNTNELNQHKSQNTV